MKRNRIICPEIAVNSQFCLENLNFLWNSLKIRIFWEICLEKSKFFVKLPEKIGILPWEIDFLCEIAWKNRFFSEISLENRNILGNCLKKSKFFENFTWKIEISVKLPEKNRNYFPWKIDFFCEIALRNWHFSEIFLKNRNFLWNC